MTVDIRDTPNATKAGLVGPAFLLRGTGSVGLVSAAVPECPKHSNAEYAEFAE